VSTLGDRIRGIVAPRSQMSPAWAEPARPRPEHAAPQHGTPSDVASVLGGEWREDAHGSCLVVERRVEASAAHGRARVGDCAIALRDSAVEAPMLAAGAPVRPPFIFFDLETTGLSGGAGTHAFLVGCGWFDDEDGFVTRQYVMTRYADERPLLGTVAGALARAGALVSFNGKSFDAPVLETRYLFHRLEWAGVRLPHLDVLHPARAFWGDRSCSLGALEQQQLGARRAGDVPGCEIPARYFQFVRSGDARPLAAVLEHNRLDLLSLAGLAARLLRLVRAGAAASSDPREALALGRVYARAGLEARAYEAYECAVRTATASSGAIASDALRALACLSRRAKRYTAAAGYWQQVLGLRGCPPSIAREASEALAIHHEHRVRDLAEAKRFALQSLENGMHTAWAEAGRHRLARIEKKIDRRLATGD
jgi:uncharacterized protein YprB with RNaseH-like and TPR domain